jgi:hypothetical protein
VVKCLALSRQGRHYYNRPDLTRICWVPASRKVHANLGYVRRDGQERNSV